VADDDKFRKKQNMEEIPMKKWSCIAIVLSIAVLALPAVANTYYCTGTVTYLGIQNDGGIVVGGPNGIPDIEICSVTTPVNNFTTDNCKAVYATLLAAKVSGQQVSVYFNDNLTCSTQPAWTRWAAVYFVSTQ
jgi:hypothetical protein